MLEGKLLHCGVAPAIQENMTNLWRTSDDHHHHLQGDAVPDRMTSWGTRAFFPHLKLVGASIHHDARIFVRQWRHPQQRKICDTHASYSDAEAFLDLHSWRMQFLWLWWCWSCYKSSCLKFLCASLVFGLFPQASLIKHGKFMALF